MRALLDTHVVLWWFEDRGRLSLPQREVLASAAPDTPLLVSDITLWEIAMLQSLGRVRFAIPLREWLEAAVASPLVRRQGVTPAIAAEVAQLPESFHRDPADRILVATARVLGATLLTRDVRITGAGLVDTVE